MQRRFRTDTLMHSPTLRWLLLVTLLFGMAASAVGAVHSHGIAALAIMDHGSGSDADQAHGHSHEEDDAAGAVDDPAHPHHAYDHSHDNAHASPKGVATGTAEPPVWRAIARTPTERIPVFRLDRPPRSTAVA